MATGLRRFPEVSSGVVQVDSSMILSGWFSGDFVELHDFIDLDSNFDLKLFG